jgi:serine/threonine protein kinase
VPFPPGTRLGPYEIRNVSPVPGLGEVYDARDHEQGRDVSLTVVRTDFAGDPDRLARFQRDASAAARLDHPRILTVHNVGADAQAAYIVSEPIQGRTLREVRASGAIPPGGAAQFGPPIAEALAAAHARGVIHGNLTPDHILFTKDGVKVIGFGLAAATVDSEATVAGDLAAFDGISQMLTGDPERVEGSRGAASGRRWPGVAAAVGLIAFAALIGTWLFGGDAGPPSTEPEAVASDPVVTEVIERDPVAPEPAPSEQPPIASEPVAPDRVAPKPPPPVVSVEPSPTPSKPPPIERAPARTVPPSEPRSAPVAPARPTPGVPPRPAPQVTLPLTPSRLVWLDRTGAELGSLGDVADYGNVAFSPDGMRVAVTIREREVCCAYDIWTIDTSNGSRMRLTSTPDSKSGVVWAPDGSRVAFASAPSGPAPPASWDIYETASNGTGVVRPLLATARDEVSWDWTPTGFLLYAGDRAGRPRGAHQDLWARRIPHGRPFTYLRSVHRAALPSLSPDGRWIAFTLLPAGAEHPNLYVARFPKYDGRRRVSTGAQWPRWRGNTIFYVDTEQRLLSVAVAVSGSQVELGPPNRVGDLLVRHGLGYSYDVSPDGERILVNSATDLAETLSRLAP